MSSKILAQGAEAKIILSNNFVTKDRIKKSYRLQELDEKIRKQRTKAEKKLLEKASKVINVPKIITENSSASQKIKLTINKKSANPSEQLNKIEMEYISGKRLSDNLDKFSFQIQKQIAKLIGQNISKLHDNNIIHGDLTTSNMIFVEDLDVNNLSNTPNRKNNFKSTHQKYTELTSSQRRNLAKPISKQNQSASDSEPSRGGREFARAKFTSILSAGSSWSRSGGGNKFTIFFIDFGLGFISNKLEDKAVDLHLLKQALEAKHYKHCKELWNSIEQGYKTSKDSKAVLERLKAVERRGRYKERY